MGGRSAPRSELPGGRRRLSSGPHRRIGGSGRAGTGGRVAGRRSGSGWRSTGASRRLRVHRRGGSRPCGRELRRDPDLCHRTACRLALPALISVRRRSSTMHWCGGRGLRPHGLLMALFMSLVPLVEPLPAGQML